MFYKNHKWLSRICTGIYEGKKNRPALYIYPIFYVRCEHCGIYYFKISDEYFRSFGKLLIDIYNWLDMKKRGKQILMCGDEK